MFIKLLSLHARVSAAGKRGGNTRAPPTGSPSHGKRKASIKDGAWPSAGLCYLMCISFTSFSIAYDGISQEDEFIFNRRFEFFDLIDQL